MVLRKCIVALAVAAMLSASVSQSKATSVVAPAAATTTAAVSAGALVTGAFIGVVAVLCIIDIFQKINGQKNWDGTPKTVQVQHPHH
jgi:hypothetical protein